MIIALLKTKLKTGFGKDVSLTFTTQVAIVLCLLFTNKILSNSLEINEFGQYNIIRKSTSVICFVMLSGMGITLPRYLSLYKSTNDFKNLKASIVASLLIVLTVSVIIFFLCLIFKDPIQHLVIGDDSYTTYLIALFYAFTTCLSSYLYSYFRGIDKYKQFSISQTAIQLLLLVIVCFINDDTAKIFALWSLAILFATIIFSSFELYKNDLYKTVHITPSLIKLNLKTLSIYSFPRLIGDFFLFAFSAFPLMYLNQQMDTEAVAFFSVGITFITMVSPMFSFLGTVLLPYITSYMAKKKYKEANSLINKLLIIYLIIAIIAILTLWFGMDFFIHFFFSDKYLETKYISRILILAILPQALYLLFRYPIDAISVIPYNTIALIISFATMVILFYRSSTLESFAYSYLIAISVNSFISICSWFHLKRVKLNDKNI